MAVTTTPPGGLKVVDPVPLADGARALRAVRAAAKPEAYVRAIMPTGRHPWEVITGRPEFAGSLPLPDGRIQVGIYLGDPDEDGRFILDVTEPEWLRAMIAAAARALAQLEPDDTLLFSPVPVS